MITKKEIMNSIVVFEYFNEKKIALNPITKLQQTWEQKQKKRLGVNDVVASPGSKKQN